MYRAPKTGEPRYAQSELDTRFLSRCGIWVPHVAEIAEFHGDCDSDAGAWHRSEHGDLQRGGCGAAASAAFSRCRPTGAAMDDGGITGGFSDDRPGFPRLARAKHDFPGHGDLHLSTE